ncbi:MAG: hypothetical protein A3F42_01965 [Gammaproteobacteria bacterium RIFCSPHIGHO2_12_FULL_37_34]|nr:MAG: hypothetical protein A3F42_01965 [Gammaproteobacteria bacterium RIFCSPHIGHO2_12_FULL_37_34]
MDTLLPSQPETYRQLIKRSLVLYRISFFKVILFALCAAIITFIPRYIDVMIGQETFIPGPFFNLYHLLLLTINIIVLPFFIAIIWHMYCETCQVHERAREDMMVGIKKLILVFSAILIQSFFIFLLAFGFARLQHLYFQNYLQQTPYESGAFLLSIFFIVQLFVFLYAQTLFVFLLPLIVIEQNGILKAIKNSVSLVWNHWWRTFSVQATPWLVYLFVLMMMKSLFHVNIHILLIQDNRPHDLSAILLNTVVFAFWIPWIAAIMLVQLKDLELRKR